MDEREFVLSLANLVATYTLPGPVAKIVTTVLPPLADFIFKRTELLAALEDNEVIREVVTQDGTRFIIKISRTHHREVYEALSRAVATDRSQKRIYTTELYPIESGFVGAVQGQNAVQGAFNLGGLIGVSW